MARAGPMRHQVRIQKRTAVQASTGEPIDSWDTVLTRRAEVVASDGREVFASAERQGRVPTFFKLRFPGTVEVLPEMRIVWRSKVFDIISAIDPDGRKADLLITAEQRVEETAA